MLITEFKWESANLRMFGLRRKTKTGHQMKEWCRAVPGDVRLFYCVICNSSLACQKGCYSLLQHSRTGELIRKTSRQAELNQLRLTSASSCALEGNQTGNYTYSVNEQTVIAEITWALILQAMIESDYSGNYSRRNSRSLQENVQGPSS